MEANLKFSRKRFFQVMEANLKFLVQSKCKSYGDQKNEENSSKCVTIHTMMAEFRSGEVRQ